MTRPSKSPGIRPLINQSACLYLLLCVWLGPHRTLLVVILYATVVIWRRLARRFPAINWMLLGFIRGLLDR